MPGPTRPTSDRERHPHETYHRDGSKSVVWRHPREPSGVLICKIGKSGGCCQPSRRVQAETAVPAWPKTPRSDSKTIKEITSAPKRGQGSRGRRGATCKKKGNQEKKKNRRRHPPTPAWHTRPPLPPQLDQACGIPPGKRGTYEEEGLGFPASRGTPI